jgi:hypothetical protein
VNVKLFVLSSAVPFVTLVVSLPLYLRGPRGDLAPRFYLLCSIQKYKSLISESSNKIFRVF